MQVSLFASAVRPKLWHALFKSLEGTSVEYEVVFSGNNYDITGESHLISGNKITLWAGSPYYYICTGNIKPAQCYEIARRHCTGETAVWIADDCEFPNDVIGKAYKYWKSQNNEKLISSNLQEP